MQIRRALPIVGAGAWAVLVVAARWRGIEIAGTPGVVVGAAPVVGRWRWEPGVALLIPVALAGLTVAVGPIAARRLRWGPLLLVTWAVAAAWTVGLAVTEGTTALTDPLETRYEYLAVLPEVDELGVTRFVDTYTERLADYPTHVKGHPPGATLAFAALDRVGLAGSGWAAVMVIAVGASAATAVLLTLRSVADEWTARRAAPFLAVLPGAVWMATSADALFTGVIAWGIALVALACRRSGTTGLLLGWAAGVVGGLGLFLTYGAVPLLALPVAIVAGTRSWRVVPPAVAGALAVTAAFAVAGFWWFDGAEVTRMLYEAGVSERREYGYFVLLGNPGAFALAVGPAAAAGLAALRDRRVLLVVGAALVALVIADVSGLSKGEVERIWLPFVPWVVAATVALPGPVATRLALTASAATGIVVETWLRSPW